MSNIEKIQEIFNENWQAVLVMLLGRDTQIQFIKSSALSPEAVPETIQSGQFFVGFDLDTGSRGYLACKNMLVSIVSNLMMGIEAFKGEVTSDDRDAFLEALNQMFSATTVPLRDKLSLDPKFANFSIVSMENVREELMAGAYVFMETKVRIEKAGEESLQLFLAQGAIQGGGGKKAEAAPKASPEKKKSERATGLNGVENNKIDLLLDLELPVMVRIGSTELKIIDIMKLGIGSIIELEKHVDDPVDLLVNDRLVARGEVVIYENNFGIRILEVVSKEERIKSLGG